MTAAIRFADHALGTKFSDLPAEAVDRAKTFILDSLGVGIAGSTAEGGDGLLRVASGWGTGNVPVWGRAERLSAPAAAFMNAWQMHNQEFDCLHEGAVVHAMATTLPAALAAAAQRGNVSGAELIAAVAVGVDVAATLGLASKSAFRFFRPATAGGFGAVAAAGRILGLDRDQLASAFAWQLAQVSGTMQAHREGSPILPVQVAFNARAALQSCEFATLGFAAPKEVFEGPYGYLPLFEGESDLEPILDTLGKTWRVAELSHKPYPAGRATHGAIEGTMTLMAEHGFTAEELVHVDCFAPTLISRLVGREPLRDPSPTYARLCVGFAVAKVLQHGALSLSHFRGDALSDRATFRLAEVVALLEDNMDPNALAPQTVEIHVRGERHFQWTCETMLGNPARPLSRTQHLTKFRHCLAFAAEPAVTAQADPLIEAADALEALADCRLLTDLAAPA
jgi:2-methylcitrate dehydratase PrpD